MHFLMVGAMLCHVINSQGKSGCIYIMQAWDHLMGMLQNLAPTLQRLDLQWAGGVDTLTWVLSLPSLQSLDLDVPSLTVDVSLAPLTTLLRLVVSGGVCWRF